MPKTTKELFSDWIFKMSQRWQRLNFDGQTVQSSFGPVNLRMDLSGITISRWDSCNLRFFEQARKYIKETVEAKRHAAAQQDPELFESQLHRDLAEIEFLSEEETR